MGQQASLGAVGAAELVQHPRDVALDGGLGQEQPPGILAYIPIHSGVVNTLAGLLPVQPFNQALLGPFAQHAGVDWQALSVLLAWGSFATVVALRRLRWDPRSG